MKIRSLWITLSAIALMAVVLPASASAASSPAEPTFTITGTTSSSVSIEWVDHSTNEAGFQVQMRRPPEDWIDVLDLRDHRAGQPQATGWTYAQTFNTALSPLVRGVCLRVRAYNDSGSSDWTQYQCTMPDLVVTLVTAQSPVPHDKLFSVSYVACNFSNVATGRFNVRVEIGNRAPTGELVPGLGANSCYSRTFIVSFGLPVGLHTASVHLDVLNEVAEAAENNNIGSDLIQVT